MKMRGLYFAIFSILLFGYGSYSVVWAEDELSEEKTQNTQALDEFAQQEGVIKRPSGLLIKIIESGDGGIIGPNSRALVHYEGRLADGTVFDSSYERGSPAVIPVGGVISGWEEALILMQIGSKWEIALPYDIAYGEGGSRGIPPSSNLFFTIELIDEA